MSVLRDLRDGKDPYRVLAAHVLGSKYEDVSKSQRDKMKEAFYFLFSVKAPDIIRDSLHLAREFQGVANSLSENYVTKKEEDNVESNT